MIWVLLTCSFILYVSEVNCFFEYAKTRIMETNHFWRLGSEGRKKWISHRCSLLFAVTSPGDEFCFQADVFYDCLACLVNVSSSVRNQCSDVLMNPGVLCSILRCNFFLISIPSLSLQINQAKPECGRQTLVELLIRPVQRLPSVALLLNGKTHTQTNTAYDL